MTEVFRPVDVRLQGTGNLTGLFKRRILPSTTAEGCAKNYCTDQQEGQQASKLVLARSSHRSPHRLVATQRVKLEPAGVGKQFGFVICQHGRVTNQGSAGGRSRLRTYLI